MLQGTSWKSRALLAGHPAKANIYSIYSVKYTIFRGVSRIFERGILYRRAKRAGNVSASVTAGVWGRSPQHGPGAELLVGGSRGEAPRKVLGNCDSGRQLE